MVNGPKNCWDLHDIIFIIFIDHSEKIESETTSFSDMENRRAFS